MAFIHPLKVTIFILTEELPIELNSRYYNYFLDYSQTSILLIVIRNFLTLKLQPSNLAKALSFSIFQNISHLEANLLPKQLYFQSSIDYNEMRDFRTEISEYLVVWSSYFLVTILFLICCFLKINIFLAQLLFRSMYFSEAVLILNSYFFRRGKKSLFLIVLRNYFHSNYTWKDFPLTSNNSFKIWEDKG